MEKNKKLNGKKILSDWSCQITWKSHKKILLWEYHIDNVAKKSKKAYEMVSK